MLAHEVPHHAGDLAVVQAGGSTTQAATRKVALVNSAAMLGGIAGWSFAARAGQAIPYLLALAAGSFVYVALADLVPQLQRHSGDSRPGAKLAWLLAGIALVASVNSVTHGH
jgi:zinc and cadmium transporter